MACLRLVTLFLERPERNLPRFASCRARPTFLEAAFPYLRLPVPRFFLGPDVTFRLLLVRALDRGAFRALAAMLPSFD